VHGLHGRALFDDHVHRVHGKELGRPVFAIKDLPQALAPCLVLRPPQQPFGHRIHPADLAGTVSGDEACTDAGQRNRQTLLDVDNLPLGFAASGDLRFERNNRRLQVLYGRHLQCFRNQTPEHHGGHDRNGRGDALAQGVQGVVGVPDGPDVHHMRDAAGEDEGAEEQRQAIDAGLAPLANETQDRNRNRKVGCSDQRIRTDHGPQQARRPVEAVAVRQKAGTTENRDQKLHVAPPRSPRRTRRSPVTLECHALLSLAARGYAFPEQ
jgi:hypothetical protein